MSGYLIDTMVLSEMVRKQPNQKVLHYMESLPEEHVFISVLTLGEIRKGIAKTPCPNRKNLLLFWLEDTLPSYMQDRILPIDHRIADKWGFINSNKKRPLPAIDSLLAATALVHNLKIVTRDHKHFSQMGELEMINPWGN